MSELLNNVMTTKQVKTTKQVSGQNTMQSQFSLEKKHTRFLTPWGPPDTGQSAIIKWGGILGMGMGMGGQQMMLGRSWEGKQKVRDRWSIPLRIVSQVLGSFWIHVGLTLVSLWTHLGIIL